MRVKTMKNLAVNGKAYNEILDCFIQIGVYAEELESLCDESKIRLIAATIKELSSGNVDLEYIKEKLATLEAIT